MQCPAVGRVVLVGDERGEPLIYHSGRGAQTPGRREDSRVSEGAWLRVSV